MRLLKLAVTEGIAHFFSKLVIIILLGLLISQSSELYKNYADLKAEEQRLEAAFSRAMILRFLPYAGSSTEKTAQPEPILSALTETFETLYYFNHIAPVSPTYVQLTNEEQKKLDLVETGDGTVNTAVNVLEMNERQYTDLVLELAEGAHFETQDFDRNNQVVILGNDYRQLFQVGDTITLASDFEGFFNNNSTTDFQYLDYTVVGFLKEKTTIFDYTQGSSEKVLLDSYFIFPLSLNRLATQLQGIEVPIFLYVQGIYGMESTSFDLMAARRQLSSLLHKENLPMYFFVQDDNAVFENKLAALKEQLSFESLRFVMFLLFFTICLGSVFLNQISRRGKYFITYYFLGLTLNELKIVYYLQMLLLYLVSLFFFFLYALFYYQEGIESLVLNLPNVKFYGVLLLIYSGVAGLIIYWGFRKISVEQLSQLIKGETG